MILLVNIVSLYINDRILERNIFVIINRLCACYIYSRPKISEQKKYFVAGAEKGMNNLPCTASIKVKYFQDINNALPKNRMKQQQLMWLVVTNSRSRDNDALPNQFIM